MENFVTTLFLISNFHLTDCKAPPKMPVSSEALLPILKAHPVQ